MYSLNRKLLHKVHHYWATILWWLPTIWVEQYYIQQNKSLARVDAKKVLIGKNVVMIMVFEQIDDNSEKSHLCVGASAL